MLGASLLIAAALIQQGDPIRIGGTDRDLPPARFAFGRLVRIDPAKNAVTAFTTTATPVVDTSIVVDGASRLELVSAAAGPSGVLAAAAVAYAADGKAAGVLVWLSGDGVVQRVVRTAGFFPVVVGFAADGKLWSIGRPHAASNVSLPGANTVRVYDANGELAAEALPAETLRFRNRFAQAFEGAAFADSPDGMLLLLPSAGELIELSPGGALRKRWTTPEFSKDYFAFFVGRNNGKTVPVFAAGGDHLSALHLLDRATGRWMQVAIPVPVSYMAGSDGSRLLFAVGDNTFAWFEYGDR